jgi:iron complex transport system substrate-binding protein
MTVGGPQIISDAIRLCGGENVFGNLKPDGADGQRRSRARSRSGSHRRHRHGRCPPGMAARLGKWTRLTAVKRGNLFHINPDIMQRHTPRILDGAEQLCAHLDVARSRRPAK